MKKDFIKNVFSLHRSGKNQIGTKSCVFGLFSDTNFFKDTPLDDFTVMKEIASAYISKDLTDDNIALLTEINRDKKQTIVLINHSYSDAFMFNHKLDEKQAYVKGIEAEAKRNAVSYPIKTVHIYDKTIYGINSYLSHMYDNDGAQYSVRENPRNSENNSLALKDGSMTFINMGRLNHKSVLNSHLKFDRFMEQNNVNENEILDFNFHHEIGHNFDPNSNLTFFKTDTRPVYDAKVAMIKDGFIRYQDEIYADIYASILSINKRKDTKVVEIIANYRNANYVSAAKAEISSSEDNEVAKDIAKYNTAPALFDVIDDFKKHPEKFAHLDDSNIVSMAKKMADEYTEKHTKSREYFDNTVFEIEEKITDGKYLKSAEKRLDDFWDKNGYSRAENQEFWEQFNDNTKKLSKKEKTQIEKQTKSDFSKQIAGKMANDNLSYDEAFLSVYTSTIKEIRNQYNLSPSSEIVHDYLHKTLTTDKDAFKDEAMGKDNFFNALFTAIKTPKEIENLDKNEALAKYLETKSEYAENLLSVIKDIKENNINAATKTKFNAVVKLAKFSHIIANKIDLSNICDKNLKKEIGKDMATPVTKELSDMFKNKIPKAPVFLNRSTNNR